MSTPTPAVKAEATDAETATIDWGGVSVQIPAKLDDWDLDTLEAFEQGKAATAVKGILGAGYAGAVAEFRRVNKRAPKVGDLDSVMDEIARVYGFSSAGE